MTADLRLIAAEVNAPVSAVCRALEVPRSTFYARRARQPSAAEIDNARLDVEIKAVFEEHRGRYGAPRIYRTLRRKRALSRKRVARRMQALGLKGRRPKRFRRTTQADPSKAPAPNVLAREFNRDAPDEAWVGDITFVWTHAGWAYLAVLVDLCTRAIVGWAVSERCDTNLALVSLNRAVARRRPTAGLVHHTDRGSTYTSDAYRARLEALGFVASMSRKGDCWDNAVAESTFSSIKAELLSDETPADLHALERDLFDYIERYYNRTRLHSTLDYQTPAEFEANISARGARAA